ALACRAQLGEAWSMLQGGVLARFLGGIGRPDLAVAADEAVNLRDADLGVDHLLSRLPTVSIESARLRVSPDRSELGELRHGQAVAVEICLSNDGGRLLSGGITPECPWLLIDDMGPETSRLVQFWGEQKVKVTVDWAKLPASQRAQTGQIR